MIQSVPNIFKIPDLRKKILFTLAMVIVYRLGCHIPTPGINAKALGLLLGQLRGTIFGLYVIFVGGALSRASVFALGIMPYISASIILQLMGSVFPFLEKLQREEQGKKKINQYTRYLTGESDGGEAGGFELALYQSNEPARHRSGSHQHNHVRQVFF